MYINLMMVYKELPGRLLITIFKIKNLGHLGGSVG